MYTKLRERRNISNVSAEEMAKLLGLKTKGAYYKKENGFVKITLDEASIIANYFNCTIEEVFFENKVSKIDTQLCIDIENMSTVPKII